MTVLPNQAPDPLADACGTRPGSVCEWVFDHTDGNRALAKAADWLVGKPLGIITVVVVAVLVQAIARRWVGKVVRRMLMPPGMVMSRLESLGLGLGGNGGELAERRRTARSASLTTAISSALAVLIWVIATILVVGIIGIQVAPLIAGAGILGVALGFGSQSLVKDCINGLFMLVEDQYGIGDTVDLGEAGGVVEKITLRATVLRGFDGTVWHVPNGEIRRVGNRTQLWSAAVVDVEVAHAADVAVAKTLLQTTADAVCAAEAHAASVLEAPRVLGVESMSAMGVTLRLMVKTTPGSQFELQRALREAIKQAFESQGIELAGRYGAPVRPA